MKLVAFFTFFFSLSALAEPALRATVPYPFYQEHKGGVNQVMMIDDGMGALELRSQMIKRAKKHIEVEYFLFNTDVSGLIIMRDLMAAAQRGVKVRVLIDKVINLQMDEFHAKEVAKSGVEIRYYNDSTIQQPYTAQFRNHRKLLSIDDKEALTGGRNIGDEYFDLDRFYNFVDRDILVKGPMVKTMRETFDKFYNHEMTERPTFPTYPSSGSAPQQNYNKKTMKAQAFFAVSAEEAIARHYMQTLGAPYLKSKKFHVCPTLTFSSDAPGGNLKTRLTDNYEDDYRHLREVLRHKILQTDKSIMISSPYMIHNKRTNALMDDLVRRGVKISIYSNSLAATDGLYVASNMYMGVKRWKEEGINMYFHDSKFVRTPFNAKAISHVKNARWGTHAKTQIYESRNFSEVMIGTYNIDPRSNFFNTEMAVFCKGNDAFTAEVKKSFTDLADKALKINDDLTATNRYGKITNRYGADGKNIFLMNTLAIPFWMIKFLL